MKKIIISDTTLAQENSFSFKEKLEIARQLQKLGVDVIELPQIINDKVDMLFVKTLSSFIKDSAISVTCGLDKESVDKASASLLSAKNPILKIELPLSPVGMEYTCHKKAPKMLAYIQEIVSYAKEKCNNVEFCGLDATRAEGTFLFDAINTAISAGATSVTICDNASVLMPDDFANLVKDLASKISVPIGVYSQNTNGLAIANAIMSVKAGASIVKTAVCKECVELATISAIIKNNGNKIGFCCNLKQTEVNRIIAQINRILSSNKNDTISVVGNAFQEVFNTNTTKEEISNAILMLGYELSEEDISSVYVEFVRVANKKAVGSKELDAIIASVAMQVPATYKLVNYVINTGNIITASAQITVEKDGKNMQGIAIGDGPIAAAFLAVENIVGNHYELDDFQINSVTEGKQALGSAIVKLRYNGKVYSGTGISTDIIGASIRAYLNALNKIVYEEI